MTSDEEEVEEERIVEYGGVDKRLVLEDDEHGDIISDGELNFNNFIMDFLRNADLKVPPFFSFIVLALFIIFASLVIVYFDSKIVIHKFILHSL